MNVLFLCVANSARSQMAEGLARSVWPASVSVASAGSEPSGIVNPLAVEAMREIGLDISSHESKSYEQLEPSFLGKLDYVIALCAEEVCPLLIHPHATKLKWAYPDPASVGGGREAQLEAFRLVRDQIRERLFSFAPQFETTTRPRS